jgi:hypothetical protein
MRLQRGESPDALRASIRDTVYVWPTKFLVNYNWVMDYSNQYCLTIVFYDFVSFS